MLSVKPLTHVKRTRSYYTQSDSYYASGEGSAWAGEGAARLGLSGAVDPERFEALLGGDFPGGGLSRTMQGDRSAHRPGYDLTFSAPKSVSIMALVGGDLRLETAHDAAVAAAIAAVEQGCAQARTTVQRVTRYESTHNLVCATFRHGTSRAMDPQLHTHCVVMNGTQRSDGRWRALASSIHASSRATAGSERAAQGFFERVLERQRDFGAVYQAALAERVQELGYTLKWVDETEHRHWEIDGVSERDIALFSRRRRVIETYLAEQGLAGAAASARAAEVTRPAKSRDRRSSDTPTMQAAWQERAEGEYASLLAVSLEASRRQAYTPQRVDPPRNPPDAEGSEEPGDDSALVRTLSAWEEARAVKRAVDAGIDYCARRSTRFSEICLVNAAWQTNLQLPVPMLLERIRVLQARGVLQAVVPVSDGGASGVTRDRAESLVWTTPQRVRQEQALCRMMCEDTGRPMIPGFESDPSDPSHRSDREDAGDAASDLHGSALSTLMASSARAVALGVSAWGDRVRLWGVLQSHGPITVLAQSGLEAHRLQRDEGCLEVRQDYAWLKERDPVDRTRPSPLIVVSDAHQRSVRTLQALMVTAKRRGARLLLLYDPQGDRLGMVPLLIQAGLRSAVLAPIPSATPLTVVEVPTPGGMPLRAQHAALEARLREDYQALTPAARGTTRLVLPSKRKAMEVNERVHRSVVEAAREAGQAVHRISLLIPRPWNTADQRNLTGYPIGTVIWIHHPSAEQLWFQEGRLRPVIFPGNRRRWGQFWQVVGHEGSEVVMERLALQEPTALTEPTEPLRWDPARERGSVERFRIHAEAAVVGTVFRVTRTGQGLYAGERVQVTDLDATSLTVSVADRPFTVRWEIPQDVLHLEVGYATSVYQHTVMRQVTDWVLQPAMAAQSTGRVLHCVGRGGQPMHIYTDDAEVYRRRCHVPSPAVQDVSLQPITPEEARARGYPALGLAPTTLARWRVSESEAVFSQQDFEKALPQGTRPDQAAQAFSQDTTDGIVIPVGHAHWTTREAVEAERAVVASRVLGHSTVDGTPLGTVSGLLQTTLDQAFPSHREALRALFLNTDRIQCLQGDPGTGKTVLLRALHPLWIAAGYRVHYLAATHAAVREMQQSGTQTLQAFLQQVEQAMGPSMAALKTSGPWMIIVDECSFLSTDQYILLEQAIQALDARAILVGDANQIASIQAGKPFSLLQQSGVATTRLTDIRRQHNPILLAAVRAACAGHWNQSLAHLPIQTYGDDVQAAWDAVREAVMEHRAHHAGAFPLVLALTNHDRRGLMAGIRQDLRQSGYFTSQDRAIRVLEPHPVHEVDKGQPTTYARGQWVRFSQDDFDLGITQGSYWQVTHVDVTTGIVHLHGQREGQPSDLAWRPTPYHLDVTRMGAMKTERHRPRRSGVEIYTSELLQVAVGDRVRFNRSDPRRGVLGPYTVQAFTDQIIHLVSPDGASVQIDVDQFRDQHWTHAYVLTTYSAQGSMDDHVIAYFPSYYRHLSNQANLLVVISRAIHQLTLITDDRARLLRCILQNPGLKTSALEALREIPPPGMMPEPPPPVLPPTPSPAPSRTPSPAPSPSPSPSPIVQTLPTPSAAHPSASHPSASHSLAPRRPYWDARVIESTLLRAMPQILITLLGEPQHRHGSVYRYGTKQGSLAIHVSGDKKGWWHDFDTGVGSKSLIGLVQQEWGLSFKETLEQLATTLNLTDHAQAVFDPVSRRLQPTWQRDLTPSSTPPMNPLDQTHTPEQKRMIDFAQRIAARAQPAAGTLVQTYLQAHRKIPAPLPPSITYHPDLFVARYQATFPAMVVTLHDPHGQVQCVHVTLLDPATGHKATGLPDGKSIVGFQAKLKFGPQPAMLGVPVGTLHTPSPSSTTTTTTPALLVAEGLETALSVAAACPEHPVSATLDKSNFKRIDTEKTPHHIVLCLDNDLKDWKQDSLICSAAERLHAAGKTVSIAFPDSLGGRKTDFNDIVRHHGVGRVRSIVQDARLYGAHEPGHDAANASHPAHAAFPPLDPDRMRTAILQEVQHVYGVTTPLPILSLKKDLKKTPRQDYEREYGG